MTREPLTKRQQVIFDFVVSSLCEHGRPPTLREIGAATGIKSTNGVSEHLRLIERKGYIVRSSMLSRGIRLVDDVSHEQGSVTAERDAYRDAFLKLAPWCSICCDRLATVELSSDEYVATYYASQKPIKCCDGCVDSTLRKHPERIVEDLEWAAIARKEQ